MSTQSTFFPLLCGYLHLSGDIHVFRLWLYVYYSDLRQNRNKLLELLTDPNHERSILEKTSDDYFSLLVGLIKPFEDGEAENKLRRAVKYRWTNSLLGNTPV